MSEWGNRSRNSFVKLFSHQNEILKDVIKTKGNTEIPPYLTIKNIYESHISRQKTFPYRLSKIPQYARNTLGIIFDKIGEDRLSELLKEGTFPREPATAFSYFAIELANALEVPEEVAVYLSTFRNAIGCCDDYLDKDRYYNVYGKDLFLISHFMLDLGESALLKMNLSKKEALQISNLNIKLTKEMREGETNKNLLKKSYSQGFTFAQIAGVFSDLDIEYIDQIAEVCGQYDYGGHMLGEIVDFHIGERNHLKESGMSLEWAVQEAMAAYEKAIEECPHGGLKECFSLEKKVVDAIHTSPEEVAEAVKSRKTTKNVYPKTVLMTMNASKKE